jgi:hypothetical protein
MCKWTVFVYGSNFFQDIILMEVKELWNYNVVDNKILNIMQ